jgi:hypothetical protein
MCASAGGYFLRTSAYLYEERTGRTQVPVDISTAESVAYSLILLLYGLHGDLHRQHVDTVV